MAEIHSTRIEYLKKIINNKVKEAINAVSNSNKAAEGLAFCTSIKNKISEN